MVAYWMTKMVQTVSSLRIELLRQCATLPIIMSVESSICLMETTISPISVGT